MSHQRLIIAFLGIILLIGGIVAIRDTINHVEPPAEPPEVSPEVSHLIHAKFRFNPPNAAPEKLGSGIPVGTAAFGFNPPNAAPEKLGSRIMAALDQLQDILSL